jgi:hypothetical protein
MTYVCLAWEFVADTHLMKLQRLQKEILCTIGKFQRNTLICDMHIYLPYVCDYITKLCGQQAQVIQIMRIYMFAILDRAKHNTENIRDLN